MKLCFHPLSETTFQNGWISALCMQKVSDMHYFLPSQVNSQKFVGYEVQHEGVVYQFAVPKGLARAKEKN